MDEKQRISLQFSPTTDAGIETYRYLKTIPQRKKAALIANLYIHCKEEGVMKIIEEQTFDALKNYKEKSRKKKLLEKANQESKQRLQYAEQSKIFAKESEKLSDNVLIEKDILEDTEQDTMLSGLNAFLP